MAAHVDEGEETRGSAADLRGGWVGCHPSVVEHFAAGRVTKDLRSEGDFGRSLYDMDLR
jgi:hypothetical protein